MTETLGIAGSGVIATGLAACAARTGGHVLWARSEDSADRARVVIAKVCERLGDSHVAANVQVTTDLAEMSHASFLVEAIAEDLALKSEILGRLGKLARTDAVITSTTSSLCIESLAAASGRPECFSGLHVFNPVPKMRLVEVAFPAKATTDTRRRVHELCIALDKEAVETPAVPGFVVNGLLFPFLFNAVEYLDRTGLAPETIDACMQLGAGHPMGPITLLDYIGLDVCVAIGDALGLEVPHRLRSLVVEGATGKKARRGLYPAAHYST
ncbi:hypothetical protein GCM10007859_01860 [Brevundimonas denitrificans]|uniref:3-hydroxybutyryl-CoA dehydrogenase n=1 Tax=Brevundimonas denitrificans TaxID=1443434 RepID=A0ABQ6BGB2_9CAUL|nr:3-hydroxyacyl-CoA dehydrogenase family protein [Brevundimonas denitrificans]GLS00182.1 hypothetical protein GCM10007859_01860 [Brevundimonas denitrificans]